jgi:hypothetical protein
MCDCNFSTSSRKLSFWNNHMLAWSTPSPTMNVTFEWWTHSSRCEKTKSRLDDGNWLHTVWQCVTNVTRETNSPNPVTKVYTKYRKIRSYMQKYARERTPHGPRGLQVAAPSASAPSSTQNVSTRYVDVSSCDVGGLLAWQAKEQVLLTFGQQWNILKQGQVFKGNKGYCLWSFEQVLPNMA